MCGFAGILTNEPSVTRRLDQHVKAMIAPISHRGPDDEGTWVHEEAGVGFGFRRLAIIDLSEHGHQPMRSVSGRYVLVFNGEVYNHLELRKELGVNGFRFRGHSDTETILAAFEHWGIEPAVRRFVGMFAIAVWDNERRTVSLIRDRLGIKPLFVYWRPGHVMFGSELKALVAGPEFDRSLNVDAVGAYLRYLYVPAPDSIYAHVRKLEPGHILTLHASAESLPESVPYWAMAEVVGRGRAAQAEGTAATLVDDLEELLKQSVRLRLQADVPVGALLSGGIDSSTVVALAQAASGRPLRTYSIGFDVPEYDETKAAAAVARHLGTAHSELIVSGREALDVVSRLPELFDEPLADPSQIPTFLICRLARREVTVALSGDGGDELFGGYHRYIQGERVIGRMQRVPRPVRQAIGAGIGTVAASTWDGAYRTVAPVLPRTYRHRLPGEKLAKMGALMRRDSATDMYRSLLSASQQPEAYLRPEVSQVSAVERTLASYGALPLLDRMMATDQATYLADDLLAKVDRASMAVSLEVRVPLLDHRVVEYAWRLPRQLKIRGQTGKWALRQVLYRYVPRTLVDRPKMGFTVPTAAWLRGPLRSWGGDLLSSTRVASEGLFNQPALMRSWKALQGGRTDLAAGIWAVLMLQAWRQQWNA
jgi:asparagine synthase (glutamine-hydrolysing)